MKIRPKALRAENEQTANIGCTCLVQRRCTFSGAGGSFFSPSRLDYCRLIVAPTVLLGVFCDAARVLKA